MPLSPGDRIGPYDIVAPLGAGGAGQVYRARDTRLNREVAVKALHESVAQTPEGVARFAREAQLLASLNHPNIGAIHGVEEAYGTTFLVLELVAGLPLAEVLRAGTMTQREAISCARQIADALAAAHERGIVHRDFKPGNVMVTPDGQVKILDFGLGKALDGDAATQGSAGTMTADSPTMTTAGTRVGVIMGTAGYMSPEQAKGRPTDRRTDVWAFGCVFYEMLTGSKAFDGEDATELLAAIVRDEPDWTRLPVDLAPSLRLLLQQCLVKDRTERLADMSVVRFLVSDTAKTMSGSWAAPAVALKGPRNRTLPAVLAGVAGIAAVAALSFGLARWLAPPAGAWGMRVAHVSIALPNGMELGSTQMMPIALSHDGTRIAYVGNRDGKNQLFVRALSEPQARPLDGTEGGDGPFFSPDGQWIGFFAGSKLRKIAVGGAAMQTLADAPAHRGGDWGDDGFIYFAPTNVGSIWRVPEGGGSATEVTRLDGAGGEISHRWPQRIAGTNTLLFSVWTGPGDDEHEVAMQGLGNQGHHLLLKGGDAPQYFARRGLLLYTHRGELLTLPWQPTREDLGKAVPVAAREKPSDGVGNEGNGNVTLSDDGTLAYLGGGQSLRIRRLVWLDRAGTITPVALPERQYENVAIAPDGTRAVMQIQDGTTRLWIYDFSRGTITPLATGPGSSQAPLWTPDGRRVIYRGTRAGTRNIYWIAVDGSSDEERLTSKAGVAQTPTSITADGRWLLFDESGPQEPGGVGAWMMRLDGDRTPQRWHSTATSDRDAQVSPDGRWVAYQALVSMRPEIFVAPFAGPGERRLISTGGGTEPLWSPDGHELFYQNGARMMSAAVTLGATFTAGPPRLVHEGRYFASINGNTSWGIAKDGGRFLRIQPLDADPAIRHIDLVLNWAAELDRKKSRETE